MAAQLIAIMAAAGTCGGKSQPESGEEPKTPGSTTGGSTDIDDIIPPYEPLPIGVLNVFGQEPVEVGHFANVAKLLDEVHERKIAPGGSNTIFASVENLADVQSPSVRGKLARLPADLTIVVHPGKRDA